MRRPGRTKPKLLSLIGAIYDCVIEPDRWFATIDATRELLRMHNGLFGAVALPSATIMLEVACGVPPEFQKMLGNFFEEDGYDLWGGREGIMRVPLEEPLVQSRFTIDHAERWMRNKYAQSFAVPQGIVDSVATILARDRTMYAVVEFSLHKSRGPVEEGDLETLRLLAPHYRKAITISRLLENAMTRAQTFAAALDASSTGIVLVDEDLGIVHANAKAHAMLAIGDPIREHSGALSLRQEIVAGSLEAAVASAIHDESNGRLGIGIPSRWLNDTPAILHVLPLARREPALGIGPAAVAAVFVAEGATPVRLPGDAMALLYSLTPAETRVFELVVEGVPLSEIAQQLGSATTTVRTHLQRIFDKTGCHRQAELVGLARTMTLPA